MQTLTFEHNGITYTNFEEEALVAAGVSADVIATAKGRVRRELVKSECRKRIYRRASAEVQMNISSAAALAGAKSEKDRATADVALLSDTASWTQWVADMRYAAERLSADPAADFTADSGWPDCPPEVTALADRF